MPAAFIARLARPARGTRDRGFALLIVLWSLVLLALLTTQILAAGRTSLALAGNLRAAAAARASADGAINEALFHLLSNGGDHWPPDGSLHSLGSSGAAVAVSVSVSVRVASLASKINPNLASTKLLAGLFQAAGASPAQATQLANATIQWRSLPARKQDSAEALAAYRRAGRRYGPPGRPFADASELGDVLGMTPALLAKILPVLSLYQSGDPDPSLSGPLVRRALALSGQPGSNANIYTGAVPVVSIEAEVVAPGGVRARRTAIVSVAGGNARAPFHFISLTDS